MQILGLLCMYFDVVEVEVKTFLLLFRLTLAILWQEKLENKIIKHLEDLKKKISLFFTSYNNTVLI